VCVEIIHHQSDFTAIGIVNIQKMLNLQSPVDFGSVLLGVNMSPASQGFGEQEDRAGTVPYIFIIISV
jgi:hypothetical protein